MAKIRTVEALDQEIDAEISWRKQELTTAFKLVQQASGPARKANLRSGVLILYAHWEGWVKAIAQLYIRYVNTRSIAYESLSEAFLGNALKTKMAAVDEATTPMVHNKFATFIRTEMSKGATLSEDLVRTESNLSSSVLFEILDRLGLERRPQYLLRASMIDNDLVHRRNTIAHGQYLDLTLEDFKTLRVDTMDLLELFTDDVRNAASTGRHLAAPSPQC
ncbi:MAE_28990/MAE_18760 family HEPN-like nuclease [Amycolatopsis pretoriensis]|uniref:MAE_28990/MAE_18760 family HEPN-like nuclease n=1 Tax=Amycolatopsis pretoriensis TaxID=218821 RepID=UPI000A36DA50|nr:MAE_28990/MAE_18760 family HEPN-like nuclease [Amycolatopsis pretoriensis]